MGKGGRKRRSFKSFGDTSEFNNVYAKVAEVALTGDLQKEEPPAEEPVPRETTEIKIPEEITPAPPGGEILVPAEPEKTSTDVEDEIDTLEVSVKTPPVPEEEKTQEPEAATVEEEKAQEPEAATVEEEKAQEPETATVEEEKAQEPEAATVEEEKAQEPEAAPVEEEKTQEPEAATVEEEKAQEPEAATVEEEKTQEPEAATVEEEKTQEPEAATVEEEKTQEPEAATVEEEKTQEPEAATVEEEKTQEPEAATVEEEKTQEPEAATVEEEKTQEPEAATVEEEKTQEPEAATVEEEKAQEPEAEEPKKSPKKQPSIDMGIGEEVGIDESSKTGIIPDFEPESLKVPEAEADDEEKQSSPRRPNINMGVEEEESKHTQTPEYKTVLMLEDKPSFSAPKTKLFLDEEEQTEDTVELAIARETPAGDGLTKVEEEKAPLPIEPETTATQKPAAWIPGETIQGLYNVEKELSTSALGTVFLARNTFWDLPIRIEAIEHASIIGPEQRQGIIDACSNWIKAGVHPNLCPCYYARDIDERARIFYEDPSGVSLEEYINEGNVGSWRRALDLTAQMLDGLEYYSGGENVIHGDLNPRCCFVQSNGTLKVSKPGVISGFYGLDGVDESEKIEPGTIYIYKTGLAGDPAYASPEVLQGDRNGLGPWTDVYSMGTMIYQMIVKALPFPIKDRTLEEITRDKSQEPPRDPSEVDEEIPKLLSAFIMRCLDRDRTHRPQSYSEARNALQEVYTQLAEKEYPRTAPDEEIFLADSLNLKAMALTDLGRRREALELWQEALKVKPNHIESTYNNGLARWRQGLITDVTLVKMMVELIDSDPGHWLPRYLLGMIHLERGDHKAAEKMLKGLDDSDAKRPQVQKTIKHLEENPGEARRLMRLFKGHTAPVFSVKMDDEGKKLLSGSMDKSLKLWDAVTGKCLKTLEGHLGYVNAVDMSADGKFAISGGGELISEDYDLKYWDLENCKVIHNLEGHSGLIRSVALDIERKVALSGGTDNLIKLWNLEDGSCIETFEGHKEWVNTLNFSSDGSYAVSGGGTPRGTNDRSLHLWDLQSKQSIRSLVGHTASINSACFSSDGQFILSGSGNPGEKSDNTIRLWQASSGECLRQLSGHGGRVNAVAIGPNGRYALSCSEDKSMRLWNLETGQCLRTFVGVKGEINTLDLSRDGLTAATGCADATLQVWEVKLGQKSFRARYYVTIPRAMVIDISEDETYEMGMSRARQAMAFQDYTAAAHWLRESRSQKGKNRDSKVMSRWVELYTKLQRKEPRSGWEERSFTGHTGPVHQARFIERKNLVVTSGRDGNIKIWNLTTGECDFTIETGEQPGIRSISITDDGTKLSAGSASGKSFSTWDLETQKKIQDVEAFKEPGSLTVRFTGEGNLAFCASDQNASLKMFDPADGRLLRTYNGHKKGINDFMISRDQHYILTASKDNTLKLWDFAGGKCLRTMKGKKLKGISALCLSDNGRFALSGSADKSIRLWETDTGKCIYIIRELEHDVSSLHMSSDAHYALTSYGDTVKMWDLTTGQILLSLEGHTSHVNSVMLSCDGRLALSAADDGQVKHWLIDWNLEDKRPAEWDEGARAYLETFLELHTPYGGKLPQGEKVNSKKLQAALTRKGKPTWTEEDFKELLHYLGCVGYGWLRPEGVRKELEKMSQENRDSWISRMFSIFTREV